MLSLLKARLVPGVLPRLAPCAAELRLGETVLPGDAVLGIGSVLYPRWARTFSESSKGGSRDDPAGSIAENEGTTPAGPADVSREAAAKVEDAKIRGEEVAEIVEEVHGVAGAGPDGARRLRPQYLRAKLHKKRRPNPDAGSAAAGEAAELREGGEVLKESPEVEQSGEALCSVAESAPNGVSRDSYRGLPFADEYVIRLQESVQEGSSEAESASGAVQSRATSDTSPSQSATSSSQTRSSEASAEDEETTSIVPAGPRPENFRKLVAVPLTRRPLFPGFYVPAQIRNPKLVEELQALKLRGTPYVGAFLLKDSAGLEPSGEGGENAGQIWKGPEGALREFPMDESESATSQEPGGSSSSSAPDAADLKQKLQHLKGKQLFNAIHHHGTFAQILQIFQGMDGRSAQVLLQGHRRLRATGIANDDPLEVTVEHLKDDAFDSNNDVLKATVMEVVTTLKDLISHNPLYKEHISMFVQHVGEFNPSRMADFGAALTTADEPTLQGVLEELDVPKRLSMTLMLLKKELELARLQARIAKGVEEKMSSDQRRYMLMEQLKAIKKELGLEKDDKTTLIGKFREKMEPFKKDCPEAVLQVIEEEFAKLQGLESSSSEFNVTRNYLDWLTSIPWGHCSQENLNVLKAQGVLLSPPVFRAKTT